jgi:acetyl esterase/lipase
MTKSWLFLLCLLISIMEVVMADGVKVGEVRWVVDRPYREGVSDLCKIDWALPESPNGRAIIFVHGGGWSAGRRQAWHACMEYFAERGYVCGSAGYRLVPDAIFPAQFEDVRTAYGVFKRELAEHGASAERIASFGSSAGGHLASMLATVDPEDDLGMTADAPLRETRPAATVALCTVFSCHKVGGYYAPKFLGGVTEDENPEIYAAASPFSRVSGKEGPFVVVVGDKDKTTPLETQEAMRQRLQEKGVRCDLHVLPGVDHGYGYGRESPAQRAMLGIVYDFLQDVL